MKKSIIVGLFLFLNAARAEVLLEPSVGMGFGSNTIGSTTINQSENFTAPMGGARFGVFYDYVFVGADFQVSYLALQHDKAAMMYTGGFGMSFNSDYVPLRFFVSLDFLNDTKAQNVSLSSFGYRAGIGYFVTEDVVANLEYQSVKFSTNDAAGATFTANLGAFYATVSFPLTFAYPTTPWRERYKAKSRPSSSDAPAAPESDELQDDSDFQ